jgi:hypothetical protein
MIQPVDQGHGHACNVIFVHCPISLPSTPSRIGDFPSVLNRTCSNQGSRKSPGSDSAAYCRGLKSVVSMRGLLDEFEYTGSGCDSVVY